VIYWDLEQNSEQWFEMRLGKVTSSRLDEVCAKRQDGKESEKRKGYKNEKIAELLADRPVTHEVSKWMIQGLNDQPLAQAEYELRTGREVRAIGLAIHPEIEGFLASTDGIVLDPNANDMGVLEIKCPKMETHTKILRTRSIPDEYIWQMFGEMACTRCHWADFVSYCADMPQPYQLYVTRLSWDQGMIAGIESEVVQFLSEVNQEIQKLAMEYEYESKSDVERLSLAGSR
jgi:hypothetical protein